MNSSNPIPAASLVHETAWVHRLARQLVRDEHLAADVAQDALVTGLDGAAPDDPAVTPRGWLAGITRRLALQSLRRRREREVRELLAARSEAEDPEGRAVERLRVHEVLTRAVRELPEPYRTAVTLRFFEGLAAAAIGRARGHTPEVVRQHVHRGLGMLRRQLDAEFGDRRAWLLVFTKLALPRPVLPWLLLPAATMPAAMLTIALLAVAIVVVTAWSSSVPTTPVDPTAPVTAAPDPATWSTAPLPAQDPAKVAAAADAYVAPLEQMGAFAGSVLLARGGQIVFSKAYGLADRAAGKANTTDTRFKLMSTTKPITAVVVMRLVQAGKLRLEDRVGAHVTKWPAEWQEVTVHDLLDHTSGIPNLESEWAKLGRDSGARGLVLWPAMAARLEAQPRPRAAAVSAYSNFNFDLAGVVAESVSGQPWSDLLAEQVFEPAGMQATGIDGGARAKELAVGYFLGEEAPRPSQQDMSVIQAAGGLCSTVGDLYGLDRALRGERLLTAASQLVMTAPRESSPHYGCGWQVTPQHGRRCVSHDGGANGFVAEWMRFPDDDACVVVLSNLAYAPITRIGSDLAAILLGVQRPVPRVLKLEQLDASTGSFVHVEQPERRLFVRRVGSLLLGFDVWPEVARCSGRVLVPVEPGRFLSAWDDREYRIDAQYAHTPWDTLDRCDPGVERWNERLGTWTAQGAFAGECELGYATTSPSRSRLVLRTETTWPKETRVLPLAADVALALVGEESGTLMRRDGDHLLWTRNDGHVALLTRKKGQ